MRQLILASLLLLPVVAMADDARCSLRADRNLDLDLSGVQTVRFVTHQFDLHLQGAAAQGRGTVRGKACASDQKTLDSLVITQERQGNTLVVEMKDARDHHWTGWNNQSDMKVEASVPSTIAVAVEVGSGDAQVRGVASLDSSTGSGDLEVSDVKGAVHTRIGSGDFKSDGTGSIDVDTVGSGDFTAKRVNGNVHIATVGSGDAKLSDVSGSVEVGSVGSGDINVDGVRGNFTVHTQGSGDVEHHGVTGRVSIPKQND